MEGGYLRRRKTWRGNIYVGRYTWKRVARRERYIWRGPTQHIDGGDISLARRVSQGQGDSRFSFPSAFSSSTCLRIPHIVLRLHSYHLFVLSHPPESLTHFAPGICRIGRASFWRWGVGSGSPTTIRGMLVGGPLTGEPPGCGGSPVSRPAVR